MYSLNMLSNDRPERSKHCLMFRNENIACRSKPVSIPFNSCFQSFDDIFSAGRINIKSMIKISLKKVVVRSAIGLVNSDCECKTLE